MYRKIIAGLLLASTIYANEIAENNWRDGFITAYKAMKVESKIQGLVSNPIDTKKYIIYYDINSNEVAEWDILMVQMFGYSSSIYKPIRTTNKWILFGSYDNRATAEQELKMLNKKIFNENDIHKLSVFENTDSAIFYNDVAILTSEIEDLKQLLIEKAEKSLEKKKQLLEENQKVAVVYIDKKTNTVVNSSKKKQQVNKNKADKEVVKNKAAKEVSAPKDAANNKTGITRSSEKSHKVGLVDENMKSITPKEFKITNKYINVFKIPKYSQKNKIGKLYRNDIVTIVAKDKFGWSRTIDGGYVQAHILGKPVKAKNTQVKEKIIKKTFVKKPKEVLYIAPLEPNGKYFFFTTVQVKLYKLNVEFRHDKKMYNLKEFSLDGGVLKNDYSNVQYSYKIKDNYGNYYFKLHNKNLFVKLNKNILAVGK